VRDLGHRFGEHVLCNAASFQGFRGPSLTESLNTYHRSNPLAAII
jgi:hypothetical protein